MVFNGCCSWLISWDGSNVIDGADCLKGIMWTNWEMEGLDSGILPKCGIFTLEMDRLSEVVVQKELVAVADFFMTKKRSAS